MLLAVPSLRGHPHFTEPTNYTADFLSKALMVASSLRFRHDLEIPLELEEHRRSGPLLLLPRHPRSRLRSFEAAPRPRSVLRWCHTGRSQGIRRIWTTSEATCDKTRPPDHHLLHLP